MDVDRAERVTVEPHSIYRDSNDYDAIKTDTYDRRPEVWAYVSHDYVPGAARLRVLAEDHNAMVTVRKMVKGYAHGTLTAEEIAEELVILLAGDEAYSTTKEST